MSTVKWQMVSFERGLKSEIEWTKRDKPRLETRHAHVSPRALVACVKPINYLQSYCYFQSNVLLFRVARYVHLSSVKTWAVPHGLEIADSFPRTFEDVPAR